MAAIKHNHWGLGSAPHAGDWRQAGKPVLKLVLAALVGLFLPFLEGRSDDEWHDGEYYDHPHRPEVNTRL